MNNKEDCFMSIEVKYPAKTIHQQRVEKFMVGARQMVADKPTMPDAKTRLLRARLILEEALETIEALGYKIAQDYGDEEDFLGVNNCSFFAEAEPNLVEIADGCADIAVVTTGTLSACGIPDRELQELVDNNNLDKLGEGHSFDEHGKLLKPANHQSPEIAKLLVEIHNELSQPSNTQN